MNNILTYNQIRVDCPYPIQYITDLKITSRLNDHSRIVIEGVLQEEDRDKCITTATANDPVLIYENGEDGDDTLLFSGVVTQLKVRHESSVYHVQIEGMSYTYLLDRKLKSRSFQDKNALYTQVIDQVVSDYENAAFIQIPQDRPTGALPVRL